MPTIFIILIAIAAAVFVVMLIILAKSMQRRGGTEGAGSMITLPVPPRQTKQPIDRVKDFFNQDMESQGYEDARSNSDTGFKQQKVLELKEQGRQECISAISEYEDRIAAAEANIIKYTNALLTDTVEDFKAQKAKYLKNIERIKQMQTELASDTLKVYTSYCRGFAKWQRAIAEGLLGTEGTGPENWN